MRKSILICAILMFTAFTYAECPSADLSGDCFVNLADLAVLANEWAGQTSMALLYDVVSQWMTEGIQDIVFGDIPGGTFQMGDNLDGYFPAQPVHTVTLSSFKISKYVVTNGQYVAFLNSAYPSQIREFHETIYAASDTSTTYPYCDIHSSDSDSHIDFSDGVFSVLSKGGRSMVNDPVVDVSWYGAKVFCDYYGYRLPSEAEWEYDARGGYSGRRFPWGDTITHSQANYQSFSDSDSDYRHDISLTRGFHPTWNDGIFPYTSPVGRFPA